MNPLLKLLGQLFGLAVKTTLTPSKPIRKPPKRQYSALKNHLRISLESMDIISRSTNPATMESRFDVLIKNLNVALDSYGEPEYKSSLQSVIADFNNAFYNLEIQEEIIQILANPEPYTDHSALYDSFYVRHLSRCYKDIYRAGMDKINSFKTVKPKRTRAEKLLEVMYEGSRKISLVGNGHPNYYDLEPHIKDLKSLIQS